MAEPKILVLVLAIDKEPWKRIEIEGQGPTWRSSSPESVTVLRYVGARPKTLGWQFLNKLWMLNQKARTFTRGKFSIFSINLAVNRGKFQKPSLDLENNEILTGIPDLYSLIGAKTLHAFEISLRNCEFDYIFRTNVSSYLDLKGLQQFVEDKPRNGFYAGAIGNHQGVNFASGCGYFISRDLVNSVIEKRDLWDHNLIDDVSLGKLLTQELNVSIEGVNRIDFNSADLDSAQIKENSGGNFHFRCKSENPDDTIHIMKMLHQLL